MNESKIIVIKSPQIKYADLGYIRGHGNALKIELYEMGNVVKSIEINKLICVDDGCMLKAVFNKKYLNGSYPSDTLENVILGHAIYDGKNLRKLYDGYVQNIQDEDVDISYEVTSKSIRFKDAKNGILVKISSAEK
jgi:cytoskeletal protein CcmA (bactofilin family)